MRATPRTDAAWNASFEVLSPSAADTARAMRAESATLERELATEREKAERYRLTTLKLERELAAERTKLRAMRAALENVADAWHASHETNPFRAGDVMLGIAEKALGGTEGEQ